MKFKTYYKKTFDVNEGDFVKIKFDDDSVNYDMKGVAVLSLGIIVDECDGGYCELTDIADLEIVGPAGYNQLQTAFNIFDVDDLYLSSDSSKIAKKYIKNATSSESILPLQYKNKLFKDKEDLLSFVNTLCF